MAIILLKIRPILPPGLVGKPQKRCQQICRELSSFTPMYVGKPKQWLKIAGLERRGTCGQRYEYYVQAFWLTEGVEVMWMQPAKFTRILPERGTLTDSDKLDSDRFRSAPVSISFLPRSEWSCSSQVVFGLFCRSLAENLRKKRLLFFNRDYYLPTEKSCCNDVAILYSVFIDGKHL